MYEWQKARNRFSGKIVVFNGKNLNEFDEFPKGWGIGFAKEMADEIQYILVKYGLTHAFRIDQIKEKFGGLRFYYHFDKVDESLENNVKVADSLIYRVISNYESVSVRTCIVCGEQHGVKMCTDGWVSPYCQAHFPNDEPIPDFDELVYHKPKEE